MNRNEAMMRLCSVFGANQALAEFNIVGVNHVLDSLIQTERDACAQTCDNLPIPDAFSESEGSVWNAAALDCANAIRARGENT